MSRQRFTSDPVIADRWTKASDGTLGQSGTGRWGDPIPNSADPSEVTDFHDLMAHEYVEQGLMSDGLPYRSPGSWRQGTRGWDFYPDGQNAGAHDLSPLAGADGRDPFTHYDAIGRSAEGIPRPSEDLSNLDDVLAGVRRSLGGNGGPEGGLPGVGGPEGGPANGGSSGRGPPAVGEEPFVPARPLPANPPEGRPVTPAPEAEALAVPSEEAGAGTAPEVTAPLAENAPEAARNTPEPAPEAASVPANPRYAGGPANIPRTNPNGGHLPADFDLHTIAENPQQHRLFQQALRNKATSPKMNAYRRYLDVIGRGEMPSYDQAYDAWGCIQGEYSKLSTRKGTPLGDVEIHHWNYSKGDFPIQVTDPRNLVHTPDRQTSWNSHQAIHEATSGTTDIWSGPTENIHLISINPDVMPIVPPAPSITSP